MLTQNKFSCILRIYFREDLVYEKILNFSDKNYQNHRHLNQMEQDMEEATHQVRQLRDDLQKKQTYIMKLEADAIGNAVRVTQIIY